MTGHAVRVRREDHSFIMKLFIDRKHAGLDTVVGDTMMHLVKLAQYGQKVYELAEKANQHNITIDPEKLVNRYNTEVRT